MESGDITKCVEKVNDVPSFEEVYKKQFLFVFQLGDPFYTSATSQWNYPKPKTLCFGGQM